MLERTRRRDPHAGLHPGRCVRCDATTTHAGDACTGCLRRAENRRVGAYWLALATPLLLAGAWGLLASPWPWPMVQWYRSSAAVALLLTLAGTVLAARGLRGLVLGRSPDED